MRSFGSCGSSPASTPCGSTPARTEVAIKQPSAATPRPTYGGSACPRRSRGGRIRPDRGPSRGHPPGYKLSHQGGATIVGRETCETAEKLWLWKEIEWPDDLAEDDHDHAGPQPRRRRLAQARGPRRQAAPPPASAGTLAVAASSRESHWVAEVIYGAGPWSRAAWIAAVDSWANLRQRRIDIHFLMLTVAVGAVLIGAWGEAVLLLTLFSAAGAMEEYALDRTQREVSALLKSAPKRATLVLADGSESEIDAAGLQRGQRVRVKPGEAFAADGIVAKGESASDESTLTGEAVPVGNGRRRRRCSAAP